MTPNTLFQHTDIILASSSPRRRELLAGMGVPFRIADAYPVEEVWPAGIAPQEVPSFLAALKSKAYPGTLTADQILITADTVVIHDGRVIGKPKNRDEAIDILHRLSGSAHEVVTGIVLRNDRTEKHLSETARVVFGTLSTSEIEYYVDCYRPYDKAGAYGIQEWIGYVGIERIEGSFYNVMGLPTRLLYTALTDFIRTQHL